MAMFIMRNAFLFVLAVVSRAHGQVVPDCSGEEWGANCDNPDYREFCDSDASILDEDFARSICAPISTLPFLVGQGDYCGRCKLPEDLVFEIFYPSQAPSLTPSTIKRNPIDFFSGMPFGSTSVKPPVPSLPPAIPRDVSSRIPSGKPSGSSLPSGEPSRAPSNVPSGKPSGSSIPSSAPSEAPSNIPSEKPSGSSLPSAEPSLLPSSLPSGKPSGSSMPSGVPSLLPSSLPSEKPSVSSMPSGVPSNVPSTVPSGKPSGSSLPSGVPSSLPSSVPSGKPSGSSLPSGVPSSLPSSVPSGKPSGSSLPSGVPSSLPSSVPSGKPSGSSLPSSTPSDIPSILPSGLPSVVTFPPLSAFPTRTPTQNASSSGRGDIFVTDCTAVEWGENCANPSHREFCDFDATIDEKYFPRSICAPLSNLPFLMSAGDYCGRCKTSHELIGDKGTKVPSAAPTASPSGSALPSNEPSTYPSIFPSETPSGIPSFNLLDPVISSSSEFEVVATTYSISFSSDDGLLKDDQIGVVEDVIRDFLNMEWPFDDTRGTVITEVSIVAQVSVPHSSRSVRRRLDPVEEGEGIIELKLEIHGVVSPDARKPYDFLRTIAKVFDESKLVLRNSLEDVGIVISF